jgi:hypothetical protein
VTKILSPIFVNLVTPEAGLLNKSSCLAPALGGTKIPFANDMILGTFCCASSTTKSDLDVQQTHLCSWSCSCLAEALILTRFTTITVMNLVTLCFAAYVRIGCSTNPPQASVLSQLLTFSRKKTLM